MTSGPWPHAGDPPSSWEELVAAVAAGDEDAFAVLYDLVSPAVYGLALRVLRDPAQAEEVAQEALLEVWRSAGGYDATRGSVRAWVLTVAHRRAVDRVRSADAAARRDHLDHVRDGQTPHDEVAERVEGQMEAERVRRALGVLSDRQREVVCLAYYGGYTQSQMAQLLGLPLGTVKARVRDGLLRLRDVLGVQA